MMILDPYRFGDGASGFRYLHDEISGGLFGVSHLKCRTTYTGDSVEVDSVDYGFVSGVVDLSSIDAANAADASSETYYDQVGSNDMLFAAASPFYDKSENEFPNTAAAAYRPLTVTGSLGSLTTSDAFTSIHVIKHNTGTYATQEWFMSFEGTTTNRFMWQGGALRFLISGGSNLIVDVTGQNNSNLKLLVCTYDGSLNSTGMEIYQDDMVTPLSGTKSGSGGSSTSYFGSMSLSGRASNLLGRYNGFIYETHIFNKVLSETERETAKEILEQYYTF
jgi:hypothetical protein